MAHQKLLNIAMHLLAMREHSRFELKQKLARYSSDDLHIEQILDDLEKNNFLSEKRFVEAFIHSKKNRGYGPHVIQQKLLLRGVSKTLIMPALANINNWEDAAKKTYLKKYGEIPPKNYADKAKRKRFLQQRGFLNEQISTVVE